MSGRKNIIKAYKLLENQTLASSFESSPVHIPYLDNVGIQIVTSGITDNTGQFSVEATIDEVTWEELTLSPIISPLADLDTSILINLNQLPFIAIRVKFVAAGGTPDGTCNVTIAAKEL